MLIAVLCYVLCAVQLLRSSSEAETPEDFACDRCKSKGTTTMARVLVKLPKVTPASAHPHTHALQNNNKKKNTFVTCMLWLWLQVLVIRLNRALPDDRRVDCSIEFPETLDMSQRLLASHNRPGKSVGYTGRQCEPSYRLFAAVFHENPVEARDESSVCSAGHYVAYVRSGE